MRNAFATIKEWIVRESRNAGRSIHKLRFFRFGSFARYWRAAGRRERIAFALVLLVIVGDLGYIGREWYVNHTVALPTYGGTYTEGMVGTPHYINPLLAQTETDTDITRIAYSGLYKYDARGNLVPDLAAALPVVSANQKQFTITLKPNLTWQDGQPLTADDVVFTVKTLQNPAYGSPFLKNWQNTTVKKIDDHTVEFDNADISAPFVANFTLGILPAHLWKNVAPAGFAVSGLNLEPVGSGPYAVKTISRDGSGKIEGYTLSAFSGYAGGKPYISTMQLKFYADQDSALLALHSKSIDGFGYTPFDKTTVAAEEKSKLGIDKIHTDSYKAVFFNTGENSPVLGDGVVRAALTQATDRQAFINDVYSGLADPAYSPISPAQLGYDQNAPNINPYNVAAANTALTNDGWALNAGTGFRSKGSTPLALALTTNDFALNVEGAQELQSQWKKVGANVSLNILSTADLTTAITNRSYDALLFSENTGSDPDPFVFWHSSQILNPGLNLSKYKNTAADQLIAAARNTLDPNVRSQKYVQFQELLLHDAPAIFLERTDYVYALAPKIHGVQITQLANPEDRFYDISHWYINTKRSWKHR